MTASETGRPSTYTDDLASLICAEMASGRSLRAICADEGMPDKATVFRWLSKHESFRDQYARAQEDRSTAMAEDILEIADQYEKSSDVADPDTIQRAKLRIDTRKWLMSKMAPKKYGERQQLDVTIDPPDVAELRSRAAELIAKASCSNSKDSTSDD